MRLACAALALDGAILDCLEGSFHRRVLHFEFHELSRRHGLPAAHLTALMTIRHRHIMLVTIGDCYVCLAVGACNVCFISLPLYWVERYFLARVID